MLHLYQMITAQSLPRSSSRRPERLLDRVRSELRVRHYSIRTEEAYTSWIRRHALRRHQQEGQLPHLSAQLRHPPTNRRLRHPHHPGAPRSQGRQNDHDLHPHSWQLRRPRRHQPRGYPSPATDFTMSTLTPDLLSTGSSTITSLSHRCHARSITLVIGDLRRELSPTPPAVTSLSEHVSIRFFSIANWS